MTQVVIKRGHSKSLRFCDLEDGSFFWARCALYLKISDGDNINAVSVEGFPMLVDFPMEEPISWVADRIEIY